MVCVATCKILEGDNFLDQFEDTDIPFDAAATVAMGKLRYFPKTTANAEIIRLLSLQIAQRFLTDLVKTFTVKKEMCDPLEDYARRRSELACMLRLRCTPRLGATSGTCTPTKADIAKDTIEM